MKKKLIEFLFRVFSIKAYNQRHSNESLIVFEETATERAFRMAAELDKIHHYLITNCHNACCGCSEKLITEQNVKHYPKIWGIIERYVTYQNHENESPPIVIKDRDL